MTSNQVSRKSQMPVKIFMIAKPAPDVTCTMVLCVCWAQPEARRHSDLVVVRGRDAYHNLPNKTLRALLWGMVAPQQYTHMCKLLPAPSVLH